MTPSSTPNLAQVAVVGNNTGATNSIGFFDTNGPYLRRGGNGILECNSGPAGTGGFSGAIYTDEFRIAGGGAKIRLTTNGCEIASDRQVLFSSTSSSLGAKDAGVARDAVNRVRISNGSTGYGQLALQSNVIILAGSGDPNSVVTASVGSLYLRTDGGAGTTLYVKESGTGNTGWAAK